jgi:hypothetical protein
VVERQILSAQTLLELRLACALIVQETGPSGAEYEEIINAPDPLERYQNELRARQDARKPSHGSVKPTSVPHQPHNAARDLSIQTSRKPGNKPSADEARPSVRPVAGPSTSGSGAAITRAARGPADIDPKRATSSGHTAHKRRSTDYSIQARDDYSESRPKTSTASSVDYAHYARAIASEQASSSESSMNSIFDGQRRDTGLTSAAQTPQMDKPPNGASLRRDSDARQHDAARARISAEMARRREAEAARANQSRYEGYAIPTLHRAPSRQSIDERPASRASSIRDGIRDYIRPRPSLASTRSASRASSRSSSRPRSRDGDSGGKGSWWRDAASGLRRKGSWASFRSSRAEEDERPRGRDGRPDLNRSLPPLPGLDQYKEKKEARLHISQLMARSPKVPKPDTPQTASSLASPALASHSPKVTQSRQHIISQLQAVPAATHSSGHRAPLSASAQTSNRRAPPPPVKSAPSSASSPNPQAPHSTAPPKHQQTQSPTHQPRHQANSHSRPELSRQGTGGWEYMFAEKDLGPSPRASTFSGASRADAEYGEVEGERRTLRSRLSRLMGAGGEGARLGKRMVAAN